MKTLFQILTFILMSSAIYAQTSEQSFNKIAESMNDRNAKNLSNYFSDPIDMTIGSDDGTYSKPQAKVLLEDFFRQNKPTEFVFTHKGSSNEKTLYAVGTLKSKTKNWSVYILMNKESKIIQLQIEE